MGRKDLRGLDVKKRGNGFSISLSLSDKLAQRLSIAQYALDNQVASDIQNYMPIDTGALRMQTAMLNVTSAGSGQVYLYPPTSDYGHYQWKGELYVDPITGKGAFYSPTYGFWSRPGVPKVPSGRDLVYTDPNAEKDWGNSAMRDHIEDWKRVVERAFYK